MHSPIRAAMNSVNSGIVQTVAGDRHRRGGTHQAAEDAADAFADHAADGGETHHRCGGERPRGLVELEHERHPQRETHRQRIAQRIAPLAAGRLTRGTAPLQKRQVHTLVPLMNRNGAGGAGDQRQIGGHVEQFYPYRHALSQTHPGTLGLTSINRSLLLSTL